MARGCAAELGSWLHEQHTIFGAGVSPGATKGFEAVEQRTWVISRRPSYLGLSTGCNDSPRGSMPKVVKVLPHRVIKTGQYVPSPPSESTPGSRARSPSPGSQEASKDAPAPPYDAGGHTDGPQQPSILMDLDHPLSHHRVSGLENGQNFAPPSASRFTRVYVSMPLLCRLLALQQAVPV